MARPSVAAPQAPTTDPPYALNQTLVPVYEPVADPLNGQAQHGFQEQFYEQSYEQPYEQSYIEQHNYAAQEDDSLLYASPQDLAAQDLEEAGDEGGFSLQEANSDAALLSAGQPRFDLRTAVEAYWLGGSSTEAALRVIGHYLAGLTAAAAANGGLQQQQQQRTLADYSAMLAQVGHCLVRSSSLWQHLPPPKPPAKKKDMIAAASDALILTTVGTPDPIVTLRTDVLLMVCRERLEACMTKVWPVDGSGTDALGNSVVPAMDAIKLVRRTAALELIARGSGATLSLGYLCSLLAQRRVWPPGAPGTAVACLPFTTKLRGVLGGDKHHFTLTCRSSQQQHQHHNGVSGSANDHGDGVRWYVSLDLRALVYSARSGGKGGSAPNRLKAGVVPDFDLGHGDLGQGVSRGGSTKLVKQGRTVCVPMHQLYGANNWNNFPSGSSQAAAYRNNNNSSGGGGNNRISSAGSANAAVPETADPSDMMEAVFSAIETIWGSGDDTANASPVRQIRRAVAMQLASSSTSITGVTGGTGGTGGIGGTATLRVPELESALRAFSLWPPGSPGTPVETLPPNTSLGALLASDPGHFALLAAAPATAADGDAPLLCRLLVPGLLATAAAIQRSSSGGGGSGSGAGDGNGSTMQQQHQQHYQYRGSTGGGTNGGGLQKKLAYLTRCIDVVLPEPTGEEGDDDTFEHEEGTDGEGDGGGGGDSKEARRALRRVARCAAQILLHEPYNRREVGPLGNALRNAGLWPAGAPGTPIEALPFGSKLRTLLTKPIMPAGTGTSGSGTQRRGGGGSVRPVVLFQDMVLVAEDGVSRTYLALKLAALVGTARYLLWANSKDLNRGPAAAAAAAAGAGGGGSGSEFDGESYDDGGGYDEGGGGYEEDFGQHFGVQHGEQRKAHQQGSSYRPFQQHQQGVAATSNTSNSSPTTITSANPNFNAVLALNAADKAARQAQQVAVAQATSLPLSVLDAVYLVWGKDKDKDTSASTVTKDRTSKDSSSASTTSGSGNASTSSAAAAALRIQRATAQLLADSPRQRMDGGPLALALRAKGLWPPGAKGSAVEALPSSTQLATVFAKEPAYFTVTQRGAGQAPLIALRTDNVLAAARQMRLQQAQAAMMA